MRKNKHIVTYRLLFLIVNRPQTAITTWNSKNYAPWTEHKQKLKTSMFENFCLIVKANDCRLLFCFRHFLLRPSRRKRGLQLDFNKLTTLTQTWIRDQLNLNNLKTIVTIFVWCSLLLFFSNMQSFANGELKFKIQKNETRSFFLTWKLSLFETVQSCFLWFFCNYKSSLTAIWTLKIWPNKKDAA